MAVLDGQTTTGGEGSVDVSSHPKILYRVFKKKIPIQCNPSPECKRATIPLKRSQSTFSPIGLPFSVQQPIVQCWWRRNHKIFNNLKKNTIFSEHPVPLSFCSYSTQKPSKWVKIHYLYLCGLSCQRLSKLGSSSNFGIIGAISSFESYKLFFCIRGFFPPSKKWYLYHNWWGESWRGLQICGMQNPKLFVMSPLFII